MLTHINGKNSKENKEVISLHKVTMMVSIPDEEWRAFEESIKEAGEVQFKYRNATIFAEVI